MNCPHCKTELLPEQTYCGACGQAVMVEAQQTPNGRKPIGVAKPVFIHWLFLVRLLPKALQFAIIIGGVFGFVAHGYTIVFGGYLTLWGPFLYPFFIVLIAVLGVGWAIKLRNYQETRYIFFSDHLEYYDGFWNIERKDIRYRNITQIDLHRSMIQRMYGLGTLRMTVPGYANAVALTDLKDPERVFHQLQQCVNSAAAPN